MAPYKRTNVSGFVMSKCSPVDVFDESCWRSLQSFNSSIKFFTVVYTLAFFAFLTVSSSPRDLLRDVVSGVVGDKFPGVKDFGLPLIGGSTIMMSFCRFSCEDNFSPVVFLGSSGVISKGSVSLLHSGHFDAFVYDITFS